MSKEIIFQYFQELTDVQREQFAQLDALYREWNAKSMSFRVKTLTTSIRTMCFTRWALPRS